VREPDFDNFDAFLRNAIKELLPVRLRVCDPQTPVAVRQQAVMMMADMQYFLVGSLEAIYRLFGEEAYTYYATLAEELLAREQ
jgi:hypothetical protein